MPTMLPALKQFCFVSVPITLSAETNFTIKRREAEREGFECRRCCRHLYLFMNKKILSLFKFLNFFSRIIASLLVFFSILNCNIHGQYDLVAFPFLNYVFLIEPGHQ